MDDRERRRKIADEMGRPDLSDRELETLETDKRARIYRGIADDPGGDPSPTTDDLNFFADLRRRLRER